MRNGNIRFVRMRAVVMRSVVGVRVMQRPRRGERLQLRGPRRLALVHKHVQPGQQQERK